MTLSPETLFKGLSVSATLTELNFAPPAEINLPPVSAASVQLVYSKQILSALQGTARLGNSQLTGLTARLDLSRDFADIPYKLSASADLDMAELSPATVKLAELLKPWEAATTSRPRGVRARRIQRFRHAQGADSGAARSVPGQHRAAVT